MGYTTNFKIPKNKEKDTQLIYRELLKEIKYEGESLYSIMKGENEEKKDILFCELYFDDEGEPILDSSVGFIKTNRLFYDIIVQIALHFCNEGRFSYETLKIQTLIDYCEKELMYSGKISNGFTIEDVKKLFDTYIILLYNLNKNGSI